MASSSGSAGMASSGVSGGGMASSGGEGMASSGGSGGTALKKRNEYSTASKDEMHRMILDNCEENNNYANNFCVFTDVQLLVLSANHAISPGRAVKFANNFRQKRKLEQRPLYLRVGRALKQVIMLHIFCMYAYNGRGIL